MATTLCRRLAQLAASPTLTQPLRNATQSRGAAALALAWEFGEEEDEISCLAAAAHKDREPQDRGEQWVVLGSPGVGTRTYASRLATLLHVPHVQMGDLLRQQINQTSFLGIQLANCLKGSKMLPDELVLGTLLKRLEKGAACGESGFILDGFPRTVSQAIMLDQVADIDLVVNLKAKALLTTECSGKASYGSSEKNLKPRQSVEAQEIIKETVQIYAAESKPLEEFYEKQGKLLNFDVLGGIPETWPRLLAALCLKDREGSSSKLVA